MARLRAELSEGYGSQVLNDSTYTLNSLCELARASRLG